MAYQSKPKRPQVTQTGSGRLRFPGFEGAVEYEIAGAVAALRPGGPALRTTIVTTVETARAVFEALHAYLRLEDGREYRLVMLAHTEGGTTAYADLIP